MAQSLPVSGSHCSPVGLRTPLAKIRCAPDARSTSQIAARSYSAPIPFSVMLLFDPPPTYSLEPLCWANKVFVDSWSSGTDEGSWRLEMVGCRLDGTCRCA